MKIKKDRHIGGRKQLRQNQNGCAESAKIRLKGENLRPNGIGATMFGILLI
jgi:hypothetical protein